MTEARLKAHIELATRMLREHALETGASEWHVAATMERAKPTIAEIVERGLRNGTNPGAIFDELAAAMRDAAMSLIKPEGAA